MIQIDKMILEAMKAGEKDKAATYRLIKAKIIEFKTAKNAKPYDEQAEISLLQKMAKEREDSIRIYEDNNRNDLADKEKVELMYIQELLPAPINEDDVKAWAENEWGSIAKKEMGFRIKILKDQFPGIDGKVAADIVKSLIKE